VGGPYAFNFDNGSFVSSVIISTPAMFTEVLSNCISGASSHGSGVRADLHFDVRERVLKRHGDFRRVAAGSHRAEQFVSGEGG